jgi:prepilin-type N-terminal cleavage/methylation domain-containing protein
MHPYHCSSVRFNRFCKPHRAIQKNIPRRIALIRGFTLLEMLVVLALIGVVTAIAAPSMQAFLNNQKLSTGQNQVYEGLHQSQSKAKLQRIKYEMSFRQFGNRVQWVSYSVGETPPSNAALSNLPWNTLSEGIQLDPETTLVQNGDVYRVRFNDYGEVSGQLGRVTLSLTSGGSSKRCVIVSTLLGTMRTGESHPEKKNKTCD